MIKLFPLRGPQHSIFQIALLVVVLLASGCQRMRQQQTNQELLELENFQLEMQLDEALYELKQAQMCCAAADKKDEKEDDKADEPTPADSSVPDIDLGDPSPPPKFEVPPSLPDFPDVTPPNADVGPVKEARQEIHDRHVAEIHINGAITGGIDKDERPGDEGVEVGVELLNSEGQKLAIPGSVAVELWDHTTPQPKHVARWDLKPGEVAARFKAIGDQPAVYLALDWPRTRPKANDLRVYVRYTAPDGRRLKADAPLSVLLTGRRPQRWSPSPKHWEERVRALVPVRPATHHAGTRAPSSVRTADGRSVLNRSENVSPPRRETPRPQAANSQTEDAPRRLRRATDDLIRSLEQAVGDEAPTELQPPHPADGGTSRSEPSEPGAFSELFTPVQRVEHREELSPRQPQRDWNTEAQRQMRAAPTVETPAASPSQQVPKWSPFRDE